MYHGGAYSHDRELRGAMILSTDCHPLVLEYKCEPTAGHQGPSPFQNQWLVEIFFCLCNVFDYAFNFISYTSGALAVGGRCPPVTGRLGNMRPNNSSWGHQHSGEFEFAIYGYL